MNKVTNASIQKQAMCPTPRVVIVGGSGFVGTRLITLLKETGRYDLLNVDIAESQTHPDITQKGDVRRLFDMLEAFRGVDTVILLAAQHRDDVRPTSLYYETNVNGMRNVLKAMSQQNVRRLIFFSSVAVYGLNKPHPDEDADPDPANEYGRSKWQAEKVLRQWHGRHPEKSVTVVRPTVIFGEGNRGNVYNLLRQIQSGRFMMVGNGKNPKSMVYVGNVAAFVRHILQKDEPGHRIYNYADKPDYDMNALVRLTGETLGKHIPSMHVPQWLGMLGGCCFDVLGFITRHRFAISAQRVRKFCAVTQFPADRAQATGFAPPFTIDEGLRRTLHFEFGN